MRDKKENFRLSCRTELERLYPLESGEKVWEAFRKNRRKKLLTTAVCAGALLGTAGFLAFLGGVRLGEDGSLVRNSYGQGARQIALIADIEGQEIPVTVEVEEQLYSEEELKKQEREAFAALQQSILGGNGSPEHVTEELELPESVNGYPFQITWESSDELAVSYTGKVGSGRELDADGELVVLQATLACRGWSCTETFPVRVFPPQPEGTERQKQELLQRIREADKKSASEERLVLPAELEGKQIVWKEAGGSSWWLLLPALWAAVYTAAWMREREKIQKKASQRREQLSDSYAELVSKLLLLLEAGMSLRNAVTRISGIYAEQRKGGGKKNYAYEELTAVCREMEKGVPEREAYRHLGMRIELPAYRKLATLLNQSNRLGASGFREQLQEEAESAWEERKAKARQKGEEAGTKLLLPMMVLLLLVLLFIMLPAYFSFAGV